MAKNKRL